MANPTYRSIVESLRHSSVPVWEIGTRCKAAVIPDGGRIIAAAFDTTRNNLFWSHPQLGDGSDTRIDATELIGGIGGDRLWFSPELTYHWDGRPNWETQSNYKVPAESDPGVYELCSADERAVKLRASVSLPVHGSDHRVGFDVEREVRIIDSPPSLPDSLMQGVEYMGLEASHTLRLRDDTHEGVVDLWHILQMPVGSTLIVPIKKSNPDIVSYARAGNWAIHPDHIRWTFDGTPRAKFGLGTSVVTGRAGVLQPDGADRWTLVVREFPFDERAKYADHPYETPRTDQVLQAWDGLGFGELEFHSPALDAAQGPRSLSESDRIWMFGGERDAIRNIARQLLSVDVI